MSEFIRETIRKILVSWDDWDAEAQQQAQVHQLPEAYDFAMQARLAIVLKSVVDEAAMCCERRGSVQDKNIGIRQEAKKCAAQIRHTLLCADGEYVCYRCDGRGCETCDHKGIKRRATA